RRRHTRSKRDWSSDVCSSDLAAGDLVAGSRLLGGPLAGGRVGQRSELPAALGAGGLAPLGADPTADLVGVAVGDQRVPVDGLVEIGRASCRERVERAVVGVGG